MIIGIDGRTLQDSNYSGVSEFTLNLLTGIFEIDTENQYRLFFNSSHNIEDKLPVFTSKNVSSEKYDYPNKLLNYFSLKPFGRPFFDQLLGGVDLFYMPHINFYGLSPKSKLVLTVHDLSFLRYPEFFSFRKNFWHHHLNLKKLLNRAEMIIAISENTKKDIVEIFDINPLKVKVIYSGLNKKNKPLIIDAGKTVAFKNKYQLASKYLLYLGTVEPRKNIDSLIYAFDQYKRSWPSALQLVIAGGDGWKFDTIMKAFNNSPNKKDIIFIGYVNEDDKQLLYNLAELFVFPSYYEGFGFPPLEAMACGVPTIASNASSLPEILGDAALYVSPYSVIEIAKAIESVLNSEKLLTSLINQGLDQASKFTWQNTSAQYLEIFKSLG
ncbi:MAG: glycosyltransferase family 1 protein [bacterium]